MRVSLCLSILCLSSGLTVAGCSGGGGGGSSSKAKAANALTRSMQFDNVGAKLVEGTPPAPTPNASVSLIETAPAQAVSDADYQAQRAANAVISQLQWPGATVNPTSGPVPTPSGSNATIRPSEPVSVDMAPGGTGGLAIQVDNDDPSDPVTHLLVWMTGADDAPAVTSALYLQIAVNDTVQTGDGDIFQAQFEVPADICQSLCNTDIQLICHKAALTERGSVTEPNVADITLRCASTGSSSDCSAPTSANNASNISPSSSGVVTMTVNNPDEANDPTVATLIWMDGADSYIELPVATASGVTGSLPQTISNGFTVTQDICDNLCNIAHDVKCYESAVTASGVVTQSNLVDIQVLCEEAGNEAECSSARAPVTPSPGTGGTSPPGPIPSRVTSLCNIACDYANRCAIPQPNCLTACQSRRSQLDQACLDWSAQFLECVVSNNYCPQSGATPACLNQIDPIPPGCENID